MGNPEWPGRTLSAGPTWIGALVRFLAPANTMSYNFARSGAVVNNSRYEDQYVRCFIEQVDDFFRSGVAGKGRWTAENSVFVSWFGINDINFIQEKRVNEYEEWRKVLDDYFGQVDRYLMAGARNFVVVGIPREFYLS